MQQSHTIYCALPHMEARSTAAVAKKADRTTKYDVRYSCKTELNICNCTCTMSIVNVPSLFRVTVCFNSGCLIAMLPYFSKSLKLRLKFYSFCPGI